MSLSAASKPCPGCRVEFGYHLSGLTYDCPVEKALSSFEDTVGDLSAWAQAEGENGQWLDSCYWDATAEQIFNNLQEVGWDAG